MWFLCRGNQMKKISLRWLCKAWSINICFIKSKKVIARICTTISHKNVDSRIDKSKQLFSCDYGGASGTDAACIDAGHLLAMQECTRCILGLGTPPPPPPPPTPHPPPPPYLQREIWAGDLNSAPCTGTGRIYVKKTMKSESNYYLFFRIMVLLT